MTDSPESRAQTMEALLGSRLSWSGPHKREYGPGRGPRETVVPTDRLIYLERGSLAYRLEGQEISCAEGMVWLVPAWTRRSWSTSGGCRIGWVEFSLLPQWISLPVVVSGKPWPVSPEEIFRNKDLLLQEAGFKHLLMHHLAYGEWKTSAAAGDAVIHEITGIMRKHLHESDLLARLPGMMGFASQQLRARFRQALQTTPGHYLEALRMQHARYLLLTSPLSIKEVAHQVGFDDPLYFSRRYRSFWSQSPKAHRSSHQ